MCLFSPEVAILWAAHQVHHSSEYYNLTTALRQSLTQQFTSWVRYHVYVETGIKSLFLILHLGTYMHTTYCPAETIQISQRSAHSAHCCVYFTNLQLSCFLK